MKQWGKTSCRGPIWAQSWRMSWSSYMNRRGHGDVRLVDFTVRHTGIWRMLQMTLKVRLWSNNKGPYLPWVHLDQIRRWLKYSFLALSLYPIHLLKVTHVEPLVLPFNAHYPQVLNILACHFGSSIIHFHTSVQSF